MIQERIRHLGHASRDVRCPLAILVGVAACAPPAASPQTPTTQAPRAEAQPDRPAPPAPAAVDWSFLGPRDDGLVQALNDETTLVQPYLTQASQDGELDVPEPDLQPLLDYSRDLLLAHAAEASARILRGDGQRYLQAAWLHRRASEAEAGHASLLRIPLKACVGWGCDVPSDFVAVDCFGPVAFFVIPTGETRRVEACRECLNAGEEARAACEDTACSFFVEGWFTGERRESEAEGCGAGWEFHVQRSDDGPDPAFRILVPAGGPPPA